MNCPAGADEVAKAGQDTNAKIDALNGQIAKANAETKAQIQHRLLNWSDAELKKFLVSGIKPDGVKGAPIMPYEFYTVLTARD